MPGIVQWRLLRGNLVTSWLCPPHVSSGSWSVLDPNPEETLVKVYVLEWGDGED